MTPTPQPHPLTLRKIQPDEEASRWNRCEETTMNLPDEQRVIRVIYLYEGYKNFWYFPSLEAWIDASKALPPSVQVTDIEDWPMSDKASMLRSLEPEEDDEP